MSRLSRFPALVALAAAALAACASVPPPPPPAGPGGSTGVLRDWRTIVTASDRDRYLRRGAAWGLALQQARRQPGSGDLTGLGVNAVVDLKFAVGKPDPQRPPTYQVWLDCRDGQVVNPLLPFALRHLRDALRRKRAFDVLALAPRRALQIGLALLLSRTHSA